MKTNIKMRVTPEQSKKVQEICFENKIEWATSGKEFQGFYEWIYIDENYMYCFSSIILEEIDADLFIRTNGTCEEPIGSKFQPSDEVIRSVAKLNGWDKLETSHYTMNMLLDKLKKKNEILKKARIKRKNQKEELHKLNLKLQKCISFEEHHQVVDELKKDINFRNETIRNTLQIEKDRLKEIEQLKAENIEMGKLVNLNKSALDLAVITKELAMNEIERKNNEIKKLKAVIEYLESKVK